jgi:2C-methyl-D-erythritol 2,4-cyclodiphosphate synthase
MVLRGPDDVGARSDAETMSAALRGAMLATTALGSVGAHAVATGETIAPVDDQMRIEQTYTIQAPA